MPEIRDVAVGAHEFSSDRAKLLVELEQCLRAQLYMTDYYEFLTGALGYDFPQVKEPRVKKVLSELGEIVVDWTRNRKFQRKRRKVLCIWPRGCVKSAGVTIPLPIFAHLHDPNIATAVMSANFERMAVKFSRTTRDLWANENSELVELFGKFYDSKRKWTDEEVITAKRTNARGDPTMRAFSVDQGATSGHYNLFIVDDPTTREQVDKYGDLWNNKVHQQHTNLHAVTNKDCLYIVVCTRYGDSDLPGKVIEYEIKPQVLRVLGRIPDDFADNWEKYAHLAGWEVIWDEVDHEATEEEIESGLAVTVAGLSKPRVLHYPGIWSKEMLEDVLLDPTRGQSFYWEQLKNRPARREDNPIQQSHIDACQIEMSKVPPQAFSHLTMHCDTAWKDEKAYLAQSGDWNVIQIWGHYDGHVYLLWQWHARCMQSEFGEAFVRGLQWAKGFQVDGKRFGFPIRMVTLDKQGNQGTSQRDYLFRVAANAGERCPPILEVFRQTKKASAIMSTAGYWQDGRVHVVKDLPGNSELFYEMLHIGYSEHDDHADAAKDVFHENVYRPGVVQDVSAFENSNRRTSVPVAHGHVGVSGIWSPTRGRITPGKRRLKDLIGGGRNVPS